MAGTNLYFPTLTTASEQDLLNDLNQECIQIAGIDVYYLPRKTYDQDRLYTEDTQHYFNEALPLVVYLKNAESFEGQGHFLAQMGLEIRDQITWTVSVPEFAESIGNDHNLSRPREGDLIFLPMNRRCFEITYVEKWPMMYPLGTLPTWDLTTQLLEYSGENFDTGIPEIDSIEPDLTQDIWDWAVLNEDGTVLQAQDGSYVVTETFDRAVLDPTDEALDLTQESAEFLDWQETDPFSEGQPTDAG